jgi:hypothetical protein
LLNEVAIFFLVRFSQFFDFVGSVQHE